MENMTPEQQQAAMYLEEKLGEDYNNLEIQSQGDSGLTVSFSATRTDGKVETLNLYVDTQTVISAQDGQKVDLVVSNGGAAGLNDNRPIASQLANEGNLGNNMVLCCSSTGKINGYEVMHDITQKLQFEGQSMKGLSFSDSAKSAPRSANDFLGDHPEYKDGFQLYIADGAWDNESQFQNLEHLKDCDITLTLANPDSNYYDVRNNNYTFNGINAAEYFSKYGLENVSFIVAKEDYGDKTHIMLNNITMQKVLCPDVYGNNTLEDNYQILINEEDGVLGNDFLLKLTNEQLKLTKNFRYLSNKVLTSSIISMQNINNVAKALNSNTALFDPAKKSVSSTANIAKGILGTQNAFLSMSNDLYRRNMAELGLMTDITQRYIDLESDLDVLAQSLSTLSPTSILPNAKYNAFSDFPQYANINGSEFQKNFQIEGFSNIENIGIVVKSDFLELASPSGTFMTNMQANINSSIDAINAMSEFKSQIGTNLIGPVWNSAGVNLEFFIAAQNLNIEATTYLMQEVKKACEKVSDYMGSDETLDTSQIPVLIAEIASLKAALAAKKTIYCYDPDSKTVYTLEVPVLTGAARAAVENSLRAAQAALDKLNGLGPVVEEATKMINDAIQKIYSDFGVMVNDISLGTVEPYTPSFTPQDVNHNSLSTTSYARNTPYVSNVGNTGQDSTVMLSQGE